MRRGIGTDYTRTTGGRLHRLVVEKAPGHLIPAGAEVHHVNGNKQDASPGNLVLCPGQAYHQLLHMRQRALDACGHASWRKCVHCKRYDDPQNLGFSRRRSRKSDQSYHPACAARYAAKSRVRVGLRKLVGELDHALIVAKAMRSAALSRLVSR